MSVYAMLSSLAGFIKVRFLYEKAIIDNIVFRCHYRVTSAILFTCCIIVTANNLIGSPIQCIVDGVPAYVINTYCWITYTFTMPDRYNKHVGTHVASPGVGPDLGEKRYHSYYQWVPFVLFFQGITFYVPHWIWKNWEQGKIRNITNGLRGLLPTMQAQRKAMQSKLVLYIIETLHMNNVYAFGYFLCEFLNFLNVVLNIYFVNQFLGDSFFTYGTDVISFSNSDQENRTDPMIAIFPRVTKCTFHKFGATGTIQKHDAMCVLAVNIINEKIYIFLWFWFFILAIVSFAAVIYSALVVLLPSTREKILKRRFRQGSSASIATLIRRTQVGDFLLLHLLGQNLNVLVFGEIVDQLIRLLNIGSSNMPTAPSTLEMRPIYPEIEKYGHETET